MEVLSGVVQFASFLAHLNNSAQNTISYFNMKWEIDELTFKEIFPSIDNDCGSGACQINTEDESW